MPTIHESHTIVTTQGDAFAHSAQHYCLECEEWSWRILAEPCRGNPHIGNVVLPQDLPRGAILRGSS